MNLQAAAPRGLHRFEDRIDELEEENRQLRDRLNKALGIDLVDRAMAVFGVRRSGAIIMSILIRRGHAAWGTIAEAVWDGARDRPDDEGGAARSHMRHLRDSLRRFPDIHIATHYGTGYAMSDEVRSLCRKMMAGEQA